MKFRIITTVRQKALGYQGYISAYLGSRLLWSEPTLIYRLTEKDALEDAKREEKRFYELNGVNL